MVVYKYNLEITDTQTLHLPKNVDILSVENQNGYLVLYALVNEQEKIFEYVDISVIGTGHQISFTTYTFIGTVSFSGGTLMFHVFSHKDN